MTTTTNTSQSKPLTSWEAIELPNIHKNKSGLAFMLDSMVSECMNAHWEGRDVTKKLIALVRLFQRHVNDTSQEEANTVMVAEVLDLALGHIDQGNDKAAYKGLKAVEDKLEGYKESRLANELLGRVESSWQRRNDLGWDLGVYEELEDGKVVERDIETGKEIGRV